MGIFLKPKNRFGILIISLFISTSSILCSIQPDNESWDDSTAIITYDQLNGCWEFVQFVHDSIEYLASDTNICNLIIENLDSTEFVDVNFSFEIRYNTGLSGNGTGRYWIFYDNCTGRSNWRYSAYIEPKINYLKIENRYVFQLLDYDETTTLLEMKVISSIDSDTDPYIPVTGIFKFRKVSDDPYFFSK